jgi:threonine/homoserine/homoserine lactone efflux protein
MIASMLWAFLPIAALMTITPGPGTAMIVRSALRGGVRTALATILGNSAGVLAWAVLSALGVSALVAASEVAFAALKLTGAAVLVYLGARSLLGRRGEPEPGETPPTSSPSRGTAFRDGLATSLANPKLAVFFVALFPQFVADGAPVLPPALAMAAMIVAFDLAWYSTLAVLVDRSRRAFLRSRLMRRLEALMGAVLIGLGVRVALEHR